MYGFISLLHSCADYKEIRLSVQQQRNQETLTLIKAVKHLRMGSVILLKFCNPLLPGTQIKKIQPKRCILYKCQNYLFDYIGLFK
jgi:hypothetical protein